ncbi:ABC transporter permease subunit [Actinoplanes sp. NPDC049265]|uniref:ABC transporter permease subunit n=1 Tax=Actinoplanes sp. NPDC049265 TaxID=3363902 RepID=UPI00371072E6
MLLRRALWEARRTLPGWAVAIVGIGLMYAAFWPSMRTPAMSAALAAYPQDVLAAFNMSDLTSAAGYLGSTVYGLMAPLLVAVFAITWGARTVAGDEDAGTLDLILAHPVSRLRLALQRFAALVAGLVAVGAVLLAAMLAVRGPVELAEVPVAGLVAINLQLVLLGVCLGAVAFAAGAATGSRAVAVGTGSVVAVLAYLANSVLPMVDGLAWTRNASVFHWYLGGSPLLTGVRWGGVAALVVTTLVLVTAGTVVFTRRDLKA